MKKYIYLSIFILGCLSFILPNRYYPWLSAYHEFLMYLLFIVVFTILIIKKEKILIDKKIIAVFLISCIPLFQFFFGKIYFFGDALIAFIYIFSFASAIVFGFNFSKIIDKKQTLIFISIIFICAALISSYIMLKQWLMLTNGGIWIIDLPHNRPFANFAQPNNCATFLILSLLSLLYLFEQKKLNFISGTLLACLFLFCLALTQSRSAWVFLIFFMIWWYWKVGYFHTRLNKNIILYFLGVFSIFVYILPQISTHLGIIGASNFIERATSGHLRIAMWNQLFHALEYKPIWGYGWNQVSVAQITIFSEYPTIEWTEHSHNILLDLLIWNGIPLGSVIIIFFVYWLFILSKLAHNTENFIALAMVGSVLSHGLLEFPLEYATFLLPIGFLIGFVYVDSSNVETVNISKNIMITSYLGLVALYGIILYEYLIVEDETRLVRAEILNIGNSQVNRPVPNIILMTQLKERIRYLRTPVEEHISEDELLWMKKVTYRYATPNNLYKYAQVLLLNNQKEKSKYYLNILNRLYNKNIELDSLYSIHDSRAYQWKKID